MTDLAKPSPHPVLHVGAISVDANREAVLDALNKIKFLSEALRDCRADLYEQVIEWIKENGELQEGDVRWYVVTAKRTKVRDLRRLVEAMLERCEGDLEEFVAALSVNAFKVSRARKSLGESWGDHYEETEVEDLKTGKPKRVLKEIDKRFIRA